MKGYLLDTNMVSHWDAQHSKVVQQINAHLDDLIYTSAITLGEIYAAHATNANNNPERRAACELFIEVQFHGHVLNVDRHIKDSYAELMKNIYQAYPKAKSKTSTQRYLTDLGVDVNDLWIASIAMERNLVLVTTDGMPVIRQAAGARLEVENWTL